MVTPRRNELPTPRVNSVPDSYREQPAPDPERAGQLAGAVVLTLAGSEYSLFSERVLIGRSPTCQIMVVDPLVSREHAAIRIGPDEVTVEDLRSTNGVYVNNVRIFEPQRLHEGDRILVGTHELSVFSAERRRPTGKSSAQTKRAPDPATVGIPQGTTASTDRVDALVVLGRVAQRLLDAGLPHEAERALDDHLQKILFGARSGLPVPPAMCSAVARQALVLAKVLGSARWFNYAVEIYLRAGLCMTVDTASLVCETAQRVSAPDHTLFDYYLEWLRSNRQCAQGKSASMELDVVVQMLSSVRLQRT